MNLLPDHPCFSTDCMPGTGRIHLPVAKTCNIFCRFCSRGLSNNLERPGQTGRVISPGEALGIFETALRLCPEIRVAGVAGPGDPLASPEALEALCLIKSHYPKIITCLSTNGLNLAPLMDRILEARVKTLTVTVNAVDPRILEKINLGVETSEGRILGTKAAEILIHAQEKGIRLAKSHGLLVKVNSVLIPGLNHFHMEMISKTVKGWGADLLNIIPLIPASGLKNLPAPTDAEIDAARKDAGKHLSVKNNCRRCRADACGIPGQSDFAGEIYGLLPQEETFSHG